MTTWYRVFGTNRTEPAPAALLEHLQRVQPGTTGTFRADTEGWLNVELVFSPDAPALVLERFLASEEGIRAELNAWAAWIETKDGQPHRERLMRHMIGTTQLFTLLNTSGDERASRVCVAVCEFLAEQTDGVYQVDERGFFQADGTLLLKEQP